MTKQAKHLAAAPATPPVPARGEVICVAACFLGFFGLSIYVAVSVVQRGWAGLRMVEDFREAGIISAAPFLLMPLLATALLGAELVRLRRQVCGAAKKRPTA